MHETRTALPRARWKFAARATPRMFAFYLAAIMALLMRLAITAAHGGLA